MSSYVTKNVLGIPIAAVDMREALAICHDTIQTGHTLHIGVVNGAKVVNMQRDAQLRDAVLESDIIFADGMSVVWASRILGCALPERVTGIGLMHGILEEGNRHGYRVYLLGAEQTVVDEVVRRIAIDYPKVVVAGHRNGYFKESEERQIAQQIADCEPDVLFVAITSPKKERFLAQWGELLNARVYHGVGGSFDVYAGKVKRAPEIWQRLGMEWLYRVLQEPGRMWKRYLDTNTRFILMVARAWARGPSAGHREQHE